jgi:hypothetical protein
MGQQTVLHQAGNFHGQQMEITTQLDILVTEVESRTQRMLDHMMYVILSLKPYSIHAQNEKPTLITTQPSSS